MLFIRLIWHNKKLTNRKEQLINHMHTIHFGIP